MFEGDTWEAYEKLRKDNKQLHTKLCKLIKEMLRGDPATGTGKPEQLKHQLTGMWSRRINKEHRIIYEIMNNENEDRVLIHSLKGHY